LLRNIFASVPEISFRKIPDPEGDSCTFLSWFLPTEEVTRAVVSELRSQGVLAGNFYWYDNNWHYIRKWDHLKNNNSLHALSEAQHAALNKLQTQDFSASNTVMSRCISTAISLLWTEEQIREKGERVIGVVKKVLGEKTIPA
jgi:8-amino-3,8-dideoxy-alpha-D-manno-octulosonate transaminase